jgi:putative restriction endonuclease
VAVTPIERQLAVRRSALRWLDDERARGHDVWTQSELASFTVGGERMPLMDGQRTLVIPAGWSAPLSMRTAYQAPDAERRYEDAIGPDGLYRYAWRSDDPSHPEHRGLRDAMHQQLPLIWFYPFAVGRYLALNPVYLLDEERAERRFVLALGEEQRHVPVRETTDLERRYTERITRQRLHQPAFQASVLMAYDEQCAVCSLRHRPLLDAAHITRGSDARGASVTSNGLALCKIHHAAFDAGLLGIRPDLTVHIREDLLRENDGAMLRHGLQEYHDMKLMVVPRVEQDRPDPGRIAARYELFLAR